MKTYIKPLFKAHKVQSIVTICCASGHDNGHHNGWNNPHNPHYPGNGAKEVGDVVFEDFDE